MDEQNLHHILTQNINLLISSEQNHTPSMRYLSACLGVNDSYIQKIMNTQAFPSIPKLVSIANHFEMEPWTLLYNTNNNPHKLEILRLLNNCPDELLPTIEEVIKYLSSL